ncbi:MAG: helix-turn-helix transcriptional regulator [Parvibaculales bacterium]
MEDVLLTSKIVARRIDMSEPSLARMRCDGTGPTYLKLGRSVKYRWSDVEAWLQSQQRQSTSQDSSDA